MRYEGPIKAVFFRNREIGNQIKKFIERKKPTLFTMADKAHLPFLFTQKPTSPQIFFADRCLIFLKTKLHGIYIMELSNDLQPDKHSCRKNI